MTFSITCTRFVVSGTLVNICRYILKNIQTYNIYISLDMTLYFGFTYIIYYMYCVQASHNLHPHLICRLVRRLTQTAFGLRAAEASGRVGTASVINYNRVDVIWTLNDKSHCVTNVWDLWSMIPLSILWWWRHLGFNIPIPDLRLTTWVVCMWFFFLLSQCCTLKLNLTLCFKK